MPGAATSARRGLAKVLRRRFSANAGLSALGYLSLVPLVVLAALAAADGKGFLSQALALRGLVAYGVLLLAFVGGIRRGSSLRGEPSDRPALQLLGTVGATAAGWLALMRPPTVGLAILAAATAAQGAVDVWSAERTGPAWWGRLRLRQTLLAEAVLSATLVGLALGGPAASG